jgi:hypothetical protein
MDSFQEKFAGAVKSIYLNNFSTEIESEIVSFTNNFDNKSILYKGKSVIFLEKDSYWKPTEEAFVWSKSCKILTEFEIKDVIFAILEFKGYTTLNFWLHFSKNEFTINGKQIASKDFTYEITPELKTKFGFDSILVKPFELK